MKKLIALTGILLVSVGLFATTSMADVFKALDGKTFTITPELAKAWQDLKAAKFELAALEFEAMAKKMKDSDVREDYEDIADDLKELAEDLKKLPIPKAGIKKSMKYTPEWADIYLDKKKLKARQLDSFADQLKVQATKPEVIQVAMHEMDSEAKPGESELFVGPEHEIIAS